MERTASWMSPDGWAPVFFSLWNDIDEFLNVKIGDTGERIGSDQVDLCADALYLKLAGKRPDEWFPSLNEDLVHA